MRRTMLMAVAASMLMSASSTWADSIKLTFEGLGDQEPVGAYYAGGVGGAGSGPGPNLGVTFSSNALAIIDADAGGTGNFGGEPSPDTILFWLTGPAAVVNYSAGFSDWFSFYYTAVVPGALGQVTVYSDVNATGAPLGSLDLPLTPLGGAPDPTGSFSPLVHVGVAFDGVAKSIAFGGVANRIGFDDITLGTNVEAPGPGEQQNIDWTLDTSGKDKVVVITHGWNPSGDDNVSWVDELAESIDSHPDKPSDWAVVARHWEEDAATGSILGGERNAQDALNRARALGVDLGNQLYESGVSEAHLIAHSAGSGLIQEAVNQIRVRELADGVDDASRMVIHATFLDGYTGRDRRGRDVYGAGTTWAENYFVDDITGEGTEGNWQYTHNYSLEHFEPQTFTPGDGHKWPYLWYTRSVDEVFPAADGHGWQLSRESGATWAGAGPAGHPVGNGYEPSAPSTSESVDFKQTSYVTSVTGTVWVDGTQLRLETGSPVWIIAPVHSAGFVGFVSLDVSFTSPPGAAGVLALSWQGVLIWSLDERYAPGGFSHWTIALPGAFGPGTYDLAFRLDSFSSMQSSVTIRDVQLLVADAIPEPPLSVLACAVVVLLALRYRRDNGKHRTAA